MATSTIGLAVGMLVVVNLPKAGVIVRSKENGDIFGFEAICELRTNGLFGGDFKFRMQPRIDAELIAECNVLTKVLTTITIRDLAALEVDSSYCCLGTMLDACGGRVCISGAF